MSHSECRNQSKKFITSAALGFCGGVKKAVSVFESARREYSGCIYILHELVHNNFVTRKMTANGAVFVDDPADIPDNSLVMIGAHGVACAVENELRKRCRVLDATCPKVKALQKQSSEVHEDEELVMLCKLGHPEAVGVLGYSGTGKIYPVSNIMDVKSLPELQKPVLLSQTTVSRELVSDAERILKQRFPNLRFTGNICDASSRRQRAAEKLAAVCQHVFVVGSSHSSNAYELVKVVKACGTTASLIDDCNCIDPEKLNDISIIGITAGASTPDELINDVKARLTVLGYCDGGIADV